MLVVFKKVNVILFGLLDFLCFNQIWQTYAELFVVFPINVNYSIFILLQGWVNISDRVTMLGLFLLFFQQSNQIDTWFSAIGIILLAQLTWTFDIFIWLFTLPLIFIIAKILLFLFLVCHDVADLHWRWSAVLDKFLFHTFILLVHDNIFQLVCKLHLLSESFVCLVLVKCLESVWLEEELLLFGRTRWLRRRREHFWKNTWEI